MAKMVSVSTGKTILKQALIMAAAIFVYDRAKVAYEKYVKPAVQNATS